MTVPKYKHRPIASINSLARALGWSASDLQRIANNAEKFYIPNKPEKKASGGYRQTYRVLEPLREIQKRILRRILQQVDDLPPYLFAVKRDQYSRDYVANAARHAGCKTLISLDIKNYFPSITTREVKRVWQHFFNFPPDVAQILTSLTVYSGSLPQGASTSSYIAVLLLYPDEPELVAYLESCGLTYSRYIDDIYISAPTRLTKDDISLVISSVIAMLYRHDLRPSRPKVYFRTRASQMTVHNLNINSGRPTKSKRDRNRVRAAVKECEDYPECLRGTKEYSALWTSTYGRVLDLGRLHDVQDFLARLKAVRPATVESK